MTSYSATVPHCIPQGIRLLYELNMNKNFVIQNFDRPILLIIIFTTVGV